MIKLICFLLGHDWVQSNLDPWEEPDYCRLCGKQGKNKW